MKVGRTFLSALIIVLARHFLLDRFALVHETGQSGIHAQPQQASARLTEQATVCDGISDHGDYYRVGTWEVLDFAGRALAYLTAAPGNRGLSACGAEAVAHMPMNERPRLGQDAGFPTRQHCPGGTAILETPAPTVRNPGGCLREGGQVYGKVRYRVHQPEENRLRFGRQSPDPLRVQPTKPRLLAVIDQHIEIPKGQKPAAGGASGALDPGFVPTLPFTTVERIAGEWMWGSHRLRLP